MKRVREQRGQVAVLSATFMAAVIGMAAFVVDVGSWFRADRATQQAADAAALAGAQELPESPGSAMDAALDYAARNGGGLDAGDISIVDQVVQNDTIRVAVERPTPGFFARLFSIESVTVGASAAARAGAMSAAKYAAPVVVSIGHPLMPGGKGCAPAECDPDFFEETSLPLINLHGPGSGDASGAFGLINLRKTGSGSVGASELADWMEDGFDQNMPLGKYNSVPSAMYNSDEFQDALKLRMDTEVLIPVYDTLVKSGSTAEYNVIGWVGFVPTKLTGGGASARVHGYFTEVIWQGIQTTAATQPAFGAKTISLVE